ncbi:hypothetical protein HGI30_05910 [Paenibacillus albicereus]|uniref:Signal peptidase I n=1 Tax=Paenibacillus albicereus TaxID=2726185 RepID=A0A6H2GUP4_9BACL|nr:hypothetical protein [Paenibacillus albicereus]QJC51144.1 hypothetical protein HGI30_05910 [Paenibacillus albicereus]
MIQKRGAMELTSFGMSMYPLIREGDVSRFERVRARDLEVGDVCLFVSGSGILTGHRLVEIRGEGAGRQYVFRGDTSYIADDPVGPEAILGLWTGVRRARRGGGTGTARAAVGAGALAGRAAEAGGAMAAGAGGAGGAMRGGARWAGAAEFGGKWITPKHWQARVLRWLVLRYPLTRKFTRKLGTWSMSRKPMYRAASR